MKTLCITIIASLFILSSCGKKAEHNHEAADTTGTHKHADGAVHKNHEPKKDSSAQDTTAHGIVTSIREQSEVYVLHILHFSNCG